MKRTDLLQLLEAALAAGQPAFARQAAQRYLTDWPGDLAVQLALGQAYAAENRPSHAADIFAAVTAADPESAAAWRSLGTQQHALGDWGSALRAHAAAHVTDGQGVRGTLPDWAESGRAAHLADRIGDWGTAEREAAAAAKAAPDLPLAALLQVSAHWHAGRLDLAQPLAEASHARWPEVVAFRLCLAECLLAGNDHPRAIALLHDAAAKDLGGQVVARHWGSTHPYRALWNNTATAALPGPMPAELIALLGANRLEGDAAPGPAADVGSHGAPRAVEEIAEIQAQLDALAARLPSRLAVKHRLTQIKNKEAGAESEPSPRLHYVLLSSRTRLTQTFGADGFSRIDAALHQAAGQVRRQSGLQTAVVYVDDPASLSPFGLRPVNPSNAWDVKTLIVKLAGRLKTSQSSLGALVIAGGPEIIPFHLLPNPTDDADPDIPSDNPYATQDENYFVPEWPVARLPTGAGNDPRPLLRQIGALGGTRPVAGPAAPADWFRRLRRWLRELWLRRQRQPSFGYSANVWRSASAAVYHQIGDPRDLLTSPPLDANALPLEGLAPSRLSYFNLHGVEDGPEWYGQRGLDDAGPEYPVALRPGDVANSGRAPVIVFSEACYGANVVGKQTEEALCLKFLDSGSRVVVGSTKIAYGSVGTPLVGADLLGRCFWQNLTNGVPAAEALRRAKLQMAQEMHQRQGYLDGEDQKTLISFVLYGDPLAVPTETGGAAKRGEAGLKLAKRPAAPATVCDKAGVTVAEPGAAAEVTPEMVSQIKSVVSRYLPGMQDAQIVVARSHAVCLGTDHNCPTAQLTRQGKQRPAAHAPATTIVTLSKTVRASARAHPHFARVTLDAKGEVIKVAVSR